MLSGVRGPRRRGNIGSSPGSVWRGASCPASRSESFDPSELHEVPVTHGETGVHHARSAMSFAVLRWCPFVRWCPCSQVVSASVALECVAPVKASTTWETDKKRSNGHERIDGGCFTQTLRDSLGAAVAGFRPSY